MKIVLMTDVDGLGLSGDTVEVRDGYARNYLLPQKFAIRATPGARKQVEDVRRARQARAARDLAHAQQLAATIKPLRVRIVTPTGKQGRLFGSITGADIVAAVEQAGGPSLDKRSVKTESQIRSTGRHPVTVKLHPELTHTFTLEVLAA